MMCVEMIDVAAVVSIKNRTIDITFEYEALNSFGVSEKTEMEISVPLAEIQKAVDKSIQVVNQCNK